ncbi:MAG TPA: OmpH family outer membrane protein [Candidatus Acidoferrales bacterium]|jgi:outer membrane protein|nr:OmpH family outer membrane protein [Candidatus Acidoferrales bacterium]
MIVNSRYLSTAAALAILCLAPVRGVRAQGAANAAAAPTKIAVINVRNAIVATAEGKQAQAQLQSQFAPKQSELQGLQKQVEELQRRMSDGARTLSDEEKAKMQREGELLSRRLQRGNDDLNEELNAAQGEIVDGIGRKMLEVMDRYSRENGYVAVLDTSAQGSPVVYASSSSDITQEIVRLYDQAYPVKNGAAAAPASPKPAAPAPAKKPTQ